MVESNIYTNFSYEIPVDITFSHCVPVLKVTFVIKLQNGDLKVKIQTDK